MTACLTETPDTELRAQLRQAAIFRGVAGEDVDALCRRFEFAGAPAGDTVYAQGDPGRGLYVLVSGKVKLTRAANDGRHHLVAVLGAGEQFGELAVFDPGPHTAAAVAITDVVVAYVPVEAVRDWVAARPYIAERILHVLARRLRRTNSVLSDQIFVDVPGRLAGHLLYLARRFGVRTSAGIYVEHGLTQLELGQLIGCSREQANKALADFTGRGWIYVYGKTVTIRDPHGLADRARIVPPSHVPSASSANIMEVR
jgi:CRP-like cAMP-binding protein